MYTLLRTHVRVNNQWKSILAGGLTIQHLKDTYNRIRLYLEDENGIVFIANLDQLYSVIHPTMYGATLNAVLLDWSNDYNDDTPVAVTLDKAAVMSCQDIWDYPVNVNMGHHDYGVGTDVPIGLDNDIVIDSPTGDINMIGLLDENTLIAVNGRILKTMRVGNRLFVLNARRHIGADHLSNHSIIVMDFKTLAPTVWLSIDEVNASSLVRNEVDVYAKKTRIAIDVDEDLTNKTVFLILDGHPHFLENNLSIYDAHKVILTLDHRQICRRMLDDESKYWTGVEGVNIRNTGINLETVDMLEFITSGTSALIVLDNDDINKRKMLLGRTDIVGSYTYPYPPQGMMMLEDGTMTDYLVNGYDGKQAAIAIARGQRKVYMHENVDYSKDLIMSLTERQTRRPEAMDASIIDIYTTTPR